jgi:spore coat polysaccharide biosynthesis protein SpsF (cytidylyltransferase family)
MVGTLGVVDAVAFCSGATLSDDPAACQRRFGGRALWEWVTRRLSESQRLDTVAVLVPTAMLSKLQLPPDILVLGTDNPDPVARLAEVALRWHPTGMVRVAAGQPFVDPLLIDRLVATAEQVGDRAAACDYAGFVSSDRPGVREAQVGVAADWFSTDAVLRLARATKGETTSPAFRVLQRSDEFAMRLLPLPPELDRADMRLSLDVEDDWEHARAIYEALGPDRLEWRRITGLLEGQPAMRGRMADLNRSQEAAKT